MPAVVIVVDMVNDFVTGVLGCVPAQRIVRPMARFLGWARASRHRIIYTQDAHRAEDPEIPIWGEHCMAGTWGAQTVDGLAPRPAPVDGDIVITKRCYDGFTRTDLEARLEALGADRLVVLGVATDICVQSTAASAFFRGYPTIVLSDLTATLTAARHRAALAYLHDILGAQVLTSASYRRNPDRPARFARRSAL